MKSRPSLALAVTALVIGVATACTPGATPTASPTPTFSTEAEAFAAAEATYRAYVDALNQVDLSDPETFEPVYSWTTGDANANDRSIYSRLHADGVTIRGRSVLQSFEPLTLDQATSAVIAVACLDVSDVMLTDENGNSVVDDSRPNVQPLQIETAAATSPTGMLISSIAGYDGVSQCS